MRSLDGAKIQQLRPGVEVLGMVGYLLWKEALKKINGIPLPTFLYHINLFGRRHYSYKHYTHMEKLQLSKPTLTESNVDSQLGLPHFFFGSRRDARS